MFGLKRAIHTYLNMLKVDMFMLIQGDELNQLKFLDNLILGCLFESYPLIMKQLFTNMKILISL